MLGLLGTVLGWGVEWHWNFDEILDYFDVVELKRYKYMIHVGVGRLG